MPATGPTGPASPCKVDEVDGRQPAFACPKPDEVDDLDGTTLVFRPAGSPKRTRPGTPAVAGDRRIAAEKVIQIRSRQHDTPPGCARPAAILGEHIRNDNAGQARRDNPSVTSTVRSFRRGLGGRPVDVDDPPPLRGAAKDHRLDHDPVHVLSPESAPGPALADDQREVGGGAAG